MGIQAPAEVKYSLIHEAIRQDDNALNISVLCRIAGVSRSGYYEQKTFWSLCRYMVRSIPGIEMLVNLICTTYSAVRLLPFVDTAFAKYKGSSPQEFRFDLSQNIQEQLFLSNFAFSAETENNSAVIIDAVKLWVFAKSATMGKL